jgi:DNA-binding beta-propeller fold protein YncE
MSDLKDSNECKIIDSIDIQQPNSIIQTPYGKFLIGVEGNSIYKYNLETNQKFRIAGSVEQPGYQDGTRDESRFNYPEDLTLSKDLKTLFITDGWYGVIRSICVETGVTTTFAGQVGHCDQIDGPKEKACFKFIKIIKLSPDGIMLYVADFFKLRTICITTGQVNTIHTFENGVWDFSFSQDGKHIYICLWKSILKYNIKTGESEIILEDQGCVGCELSKDGQILFIANEYAYIQVVNLVTNELIATITTTFRPAKLLITTNGNQIYVCNDGNGVRILNISKYCTNFKTFIQLQLSKYSFLPRQVIKSFSI